MTELDPFERRLEAALRRHVADVTSALDPVGFAHAVATAEPHPARWRTWSRPRLGARGMRLAWLLVAVGLLAALISAALLAGEREPMATGWQRLDLPGGGTIAAVAPISNGYVAVGLDATKRDAFWTSPDCRHWTSAATDVGTSGDSGLVVVAGGAAGYVAIDEGGRAWQSGDGRSWHAAASLPDAASVNGLAYGQGLFVAVGARNSGAGVGQAIWTSRDGAGWTMARPAPGFSFSRVADLPETVNSVVASDAGFVAVGATQRGLPIWRSHDGLNWTQGSLVEPADPSAAPTDPSRLQLVRGSPSAGFVAIGFQVTGPGLWTSRDGSSWTFDWAGGPWDPEMHVGVTNFGFAAVLNASPILNPDPGWPTAPAPTASGDESYPWQPALWTSPDARDWTIRPMPVANRGTADRVFACGSDLIVRGSVVGAEHASGWDLIPTMWLYAGGADAPPPDPLASESPS